MASEQPKKRVEHELFVRAFLSTAPPDRVANQFSGVMRETNLEGGEVLFRQGDAANQLYFIARGRMSLQASVGRPRVSESGSLIGMLDASIPRVRTHTAVALEETEVFWIDFVDYLEILEDNFGFAVDTLAAGARSYCQLAERFDAMTVFRTGSGTRAPSLPQAQPDTIGRLLVLQQVPLFRSAPVQALAQLARLANSSNWSAGEELFVADDAADKFHVVTAGLVTARHHRSGLTCDFEPGQIVTDLAVLGMDRHEYSAVATKPCSTIDLDLEDVFDVAEDHFDVCRSMLSHVASERARLSDAAAQRAVELGRVTI